MKILRRIDRALWGEDSVFADVASTAVLLVVAIAVVVEFIRFAAIWPHGGS